MTFDASTENRRQTISGSRFHDLIQMEYDYLTRQFVSNEEMGEKRVGLLVSLTAGIGAAALLAESKSTAGLSLSLPGLFIVISAVWLVVTYITFLRILHRNAETDRLKRQLTAVRRWFVAEASPNRVHLPYDPYGEPTGHTGLDFLRGHGGYAELVGFIASITAGALIWQVARLASTADFLAPHASQPGAEGLGLALAGGTSYLTWRALAAIARSKYRTEQGSLAESPPAPKDASGGAVPGDPS